MKKKILWMILSSIIFTIGSITSVKWSNEPCLAWNLFGQQQYIPHFSWSIPNTSHLWTYLFPIYKYNVVENSSLCGIMNLNTSVISNNTYTYCKNWILKDLVLYNISNTEQDLDTTTYTNTQCQQIKNSDCSINNTIIKDWESATFFETSNSLSWICKNEIRTCNNWILSWSYYHTNCINYNWLCGLSSNQSYTTLPLVNLCSAWNLIYSNPLFNTVANQRSWTCQWLQWNNETCIAYKTIKDQSIGQCKLYSWGVVSLTKESQFLCNIWEANNITESTYWRNWICTTEYGNSSQCSVKKSINASGNIIYSYNRDWSITASITNITPYWAYISNNNNSNSKRFTQNWSFIFQLKFNEYVTDIPVKINTINNRTIQIKDLILDYNNNRCKKNNWIKLSTSSRYNLLDAQTMVNHCLMPITNTKKWYNINMNAYIKRWEFIKSIFNLIKTIRPYINNEYYHNSNIKIWWVPNTTEDQDAIKWLIGIQWHKYINHTTSNQNLSFKRNNTITKKEIYDTLSYVLNLHDDNDIYFKGLWNRESIQNNIKRSQYSIIIRKLLEQYERISLWNNILSLQNIQTKINSTSNPQEELSLIYSLLKEKTPDDFEKNGLSKRYLLNDISILLNNWEFSKKSIITISLTNIINKIWSQEYWSTPKERSLQLFKKMTY